MITLPVWPTCRGWVMLCAALASLLNAMVNPNLASFVFCAGVCSVVAASMALCAFSLTKISLRRDIGRDAMRNTAVLLPVTVSNKGALTRQALLVREIEGFTGLPVFDTVVDPLLPGETRMVQRLPLARKRGRFHLSDLMLIGGDPAGLFRRTRVFKLPDEVVVRPDKIRVTWMPIRIKGRIQVSPSGRGAGSSGFGQDFFGVREYRPADGVRFIHWKASAKQRKLMVKEFEEQEIPQVSIVLDCHAKNVGLDQIDSNFETLVKLAASMADYLGGLYCRMAFIAGPRDNASPSICETGLAFSLRRDIMEILTDLAPSSASLLELLDSSMGMHPPGSILYILSLSVPDGIESRLDALAEGDVEVRWILAPKELFLPSGNEGSSLGFQIPESLRPQPLICGPKTKLSSLLEYG